MRSDVDMMLGIAPCQDCRDDLLFATPIIRAQYASRPVKLTVNPHLFRYGGLASGKWSTEFDACTECGRSDGRHGGFGLCRPCYMRGWYRGKQEGKAA